MKNENGFEGKPYYSYSDEELLEEVIQEDNLKNSDLGGERKQCHNEKQIIQEQLDTKIS